MQCSCCAHRCKILSRGNGLAEGRVTIAFSCILLRLLFSISTSSIVDLPLQELPRYFTKPLATHLYSQASVTPIYKQRQSSHSFQNQNSFSPPVPPSPHHVHHLSLLDRARRPLEITISRPSLQTRFARVRIQLTSRRPKGLSDTLRTPRSLLYLPRYVGRAAREQAQRRPHEQPSLRVRATDFHF